jgi:purine nucleoside permease
VLRSGSDYTVQPDGQTPAEVLASEVSGALSSGFRESLNDVYEVGGIVVKKLSSDWNIYADQVPSSVVVPPLPTVTKN